MKSVEIRLSVRNFVEFILRSGNIDSRKMSGGDDAMQEGSRLHRQIQKKMGSNYTAEVSLAHTVYEEDYSIRIEGRADGIIEEEIRFVDEIKCTYRELRKITEPVLVHLAQAKCYAYIHAYDKRLEEIGVQMTYCNIDSEEVIRFREVFTFSELELWFDGLILAYKKWADFEYYWKGKRKESIKQLAFPFEYREGQKELITHVYRTICHSKKLYIQAPTGVGKTISTLFPAIKAVGEEKADKIFYFTAKTITRTVAEETIQLLRKEQLAYKSVLLTAKEKICFLEKAECNPDKCSYALGHYDRINDAVYHLLTKEDSFTREKIEEVALQFRVCPFELGLDMSLFSDAIICDYNYVFDPYVYLRRFFTEGIKGDYLFLVDEAHNLVERGREMYSASLVKEDFLALKKVIKPYNVKMEKQLEKCNKELLLIKREQDCSELSGGTDPFVMSLLRLHATMSEYLEEHDDSPVKEEVLNFYFEVSRYLDVYEKMDENYTIYAKEQDDGSFMIKEFCVNPTKRIKECLDRGISSILFSATFLPIQYYKSLLGGDPEDFEVYANSTFDPKKRKLIIGSEVTSKYSRRSDVEYYNIACYVYEIVKSRRGNYMLFFPSHLFLEQVLEAYQAYFWDEQTQECIVQSDYMKEDEREAFLERFMGSGEETLNKEVLEDIIKMEIDFEEEKTLLAFCVLGGIFSEGIDLKNDKLIGAIIVGTGIPQVCEEREILKRYFDEKQKNGFDYAYRYPGMNKVLQAAGRVIRTNDDIGVVALLDERFLSPQYSNMFPREWEEYDVLGSRECAQNIGRFWETWDAK